MLDFLKERLEDDQEDQILLEQEEDGTFVATSPGAGPRHFKFSPDARHAYAINELNSTIVTYDYDAASGRLTPKQTITTLAPGTIKQNTTAEIRVHPNGKFVYGSNRGDDSIAVFAVEPDGILSPLEIVPTRGKNPRNFSLSPDGRWLVVGHQDTPLLTLFYVEDDGRLLGRHVPEAADVSGVPAIALVRELVTREVDLLGVEDDHVVTDVEVRREARLVLAPENRRHLGRQAPQHLPLGVDDEPLPFDLALLRHQRRHRDLSHSLDVSGRPDRRICNAIP